ncbi:Non-specific serine/threonine protein kinase [Paragonimus heterotremus]|uniref:non-specific serine/threonine protein kinase n=1 Tax=Paragonimus heterotremus TaxID=100268 RepID=A0A8J4WKD2_9TREM|nr:Non-specific serine/threonine protein kinase [Paragonimus heterotremus]
MSNATNRICSKTEPQSNGLEREVSTRSAVTRRKSKHDRILLGRYKLDRTIGTGNFAKVKLATHLSTGKQVAIKIIDKSELSSSSRKKLSREVNLMKGLDHPNIIKLLEIIDTEKIMYLVLEYASGGELYEYLAVHGRMKEKTAREKFRQILSAVEYCHQKCIIHRDLKMENLLLDSDLNIKLADFGFANEYQVGKKLNTFCGSPPYAAPELFRGKEYEGPEVDVWSLGVILFKLVTGNLPFDGHSLSELRERVLRGRYRIPFYMSTECERLLKKMLVLNPAKRYSLQALMKDRWVNMTFEDDPLVPYVEPKADKTDPSRIDALMNMGFSLDAIVRSLKNNEFNEIYATYTLLEKRWPSVQQKIENGLDETSTSEKRSRTPTPTGSGKQTVIVMNGKHGEATTGWNSNEQVMQVDNPRGNKEEPTRENPPDEPTTELVCITATPKPPSVENIEKPTEKIITIYRETTSPETEKKVEDKPVERKRVRRPLTTYDITVPPISESIRESEHSLTPTHWFPTKGTGKPNWAKETVEDALGLPPLVARNSPVKRTQSINAPAMSDRLRNGPITIVAESKPTEQVFKIILLPSSDYERLQTAPAVEPPVFSRFAPERQTVHSTYQPTTIQLAQPTGVAENKDSKVSAARTNLANIDFEEQTFYVDEIPETIKPKGFFRSLTSRFQRRPMQERLDADAFADQKPLKTNVIPTNPNEAPIIPQQALPRSDTNSSKQRLTMQTLSTNRSLRESPRTIAPSTMGDSAYSSTDEQERNVTGFFRSFALRLSKRKHNDSESNNSVTSEANKHQPGSTTSLRRSEIGKTVRNDRLRPTSSPGSTPDSGQCRTKTSSEGPKIQSGQPYLPKAVTDIVDIPSVKFNQKTLEQAKPRTLRFTWSMKATSRRTPDEIMTEVRRVLLKNRYAFEQQQRYLFICEDNLDTADKAVSWELEICGVPRLNMHGIRFKKITGTSVAYKNIVAKIVNELDI